MNDITMRIIRAMFDDKKHDIRDPASLPNLAKRLWLDDSIRVLMQPMQVDAVDVENAKGDAFNPKHNPDVPRAALKQAEDAFELRIEEEGMFGIVAEFRNSEGDWEQTDATWGFVGDDGIGSGYDADLLRSAVDAAAKRLGNK